MAIAVIPVTIGMGPLTVVFHRTPTVLTWGEIAHVHCHLGRDGRVTRIFLAAADGRRIGFGNTGGVDFESMHELFANQLGPTVVRRCSRSLRD